MPLQKPAEPFLVELIHSFAELILVRPHFVQVHFELFHENRGNALFDQNVVGANADLAEIGIS